MASPQLPENYPKKVDEDNHVVREYEGANDRVVEESDAIWRVQPIKTDDSEIKVDFLGYSRRTHETNTNPGDDDNLDSIDQQFQASLIGIDASHEFDSGWKAQASHDIGNYSNKTSEGENVWSNEHKVSLWQSAYSLTDAQGDGVLLKSELGSASVRGRPPTSESGSLNFPGSGSVNIASSELIIQNDGTQVELGVGIDAGILDRKKKSDDAPDSENTSGGLEDKLLTVTSIFGFSYESRNGEDTDGDGRGEYGDKVTVPLVLLPFEINFGGFEEKTLEERIAALEEPIKMATEDILPEVIGY